MIGAHRIPHAPPPRHSSPSTFSPHAALRDGTSAKEEKPLIVAVQGLHSMQASRIELRIRARRPVMPAAEFLSQQTLRPSEAASR
ncbi:MAG: hypothetical protein GXC94_11570 [Comamonadaceae bacterium]|nr:hypothetical protein [Comamonadaceae bacterium]